MKTTPEKKTRHLPRRSGVGARQVLIPGSRKASPHPWRQRLIESREGGPATTTGGDDQ